MALSMLQGGLSEGIPPTLARASLAHGTLTRSDSSKNARAATLRRCKSRDLEML